MSNHQHQLILNKKNKNMTQNVKGSIYIFVFLFLKYYLQPASIWPALHVHTKPPFTWNLWSYIPRRPFTTQHNMSLQANLQITTKYPTVYVYVYRYYIHLPWLCEYWNTHLILHQSGQIIIFHQPRFPWNFRGFPLLFTTIWGENSCFRSRCHLTRSITCVFFFAVKKRDTFHPHPSQSSPGKSSHMLEDTTVSASLMGV